MTKLAEVLRMNIYIYIYIYINKNLYFASSHSEYIYIVTILTSIQSILLKICSLCNQH